MNNIFRSRLNFLPKWYFFFIPITFVVILIIVIVSSYLFHEETAIDFSNENFRNESKSLYWDEDISDIKFGSPIEENGKKYYELNGSPLSIVFKPQYFNWNKNLVFSSVIGDSENWNIRITCNDCEDKDAQLRNWQPFYLAKLNNYEEVKKIGNVKIFSKEEKQYNNEPKNISEWVKTNLTSGDSIETYGNVIDLNLITNSNVSGANEGPTEIDTNMRGNQQYYIYLKDKLDLEVIKKDLNYYYGADSVQVALLDVNQNEIYSTILEDDGITAVDTLTFAPQISKKIIQKVDKEGVYILSFKALEDAGNDWIIDYLKINTNKIVLSANNTILNDSTKIYTNVYKDKTIQANIWLNDGVQKINFNGQGTNNIFSQEISENDFYKQKDITIRPDSYEIELHGPIYLNGFIFAFSQENYFEPFLFDLNNINPSIIVANYDYEKIDNKTTKVYKTFAYKEIAPLLNTGKIKIQISNKVLENIYSQKKRYLNQGYFPLLKYDNYELWGRDSIDKHSGDWKSIEDMLNQVLPSGATLLVDEFADIDKSSFFNQDAPFDVSFEINNYPFNAKGNHQFYVYLTDHVDMTVTKQDINEVAGSDGVQIIITDINNHEVCRTYLDDDGNDREDKVPSEEIQKGISCSNLQPGVYIISFIEDSSQTKGNKGDFVIKNISINTNKLIAKDYLYSISSNDIYLNNNESKIIQTMYRGSEIIDPKVMYVEGKNSQKITFEKDKKQFDIKLSAGENTIHLPNERVSIKGSNCALNSSNWFEPEKIAIRSDQTLVNYILIENPKSDESIIKEVGIDLQ